MSVVSRKEMLGIVEAVAVVAKSKLVEQGCHLVFHNGRVYGYDGSVSVSLPFPDKDVFGTVNAKNLLAVLQKLKSSKTDDLEITTSDREMLLSSGKFRAGIVLDADIRNPVLNIEVPTKWIDLPTETLTALAIALKSVHRGNAEPVLGCIHMDVDRIEATDGFRVTRVTIPGAKLPSAMIPADSAENLLDFKADKYAIKDGILFFGCEGGAVLSVQLFDGEYVDVSRALKATGKKVPLPSNMTDVLSRIRSFATTDQNVGEEAITVKVDGGQWSFESRNMEGWCSETVDGDKADGAFSFRVNPQLLTYMLGMVSSIMVTPKSVVLAGQKGPMEITHAVALMTMH